MNKIKWMVIALLAVCVSAPAFAQTAAQIKFTKALEQQAAKAARKHNQAQAAVCAYCGEKIRYIYQHCSAQGSVGLCSTEKAAPQADTASAPAENCPICGEKLTIDERFHGAKHVCPEVKPGPGGVCFYCKQSIETTHQHCPAQGSVGLCSDTEIKTQTEATAAPEECCPICGERLTVDERFHGVKHVCPEVKPGPNGVCFYCKQSIETTHQHCPAQGSVGLCSTEEIKMQADTASAPTENCPLCGEKLTVDERFHGVKHVCKKTESKIKNYCIYCGEKIVKQGQRCNPSKTAPLCTVSCPECGANLRDPKNLCKDGVHHCKFKLLIHPAPMRK